MGSTRVIAVVLVTATVSMFGMGVHHHTVGNDSAADRLTDTITGAQTANSQGKTGHVSLPDGFQIQVYADMEALGGFDNYGNVDPHGGANPGVRFMAFRDGTLYVAVPGQPYSDGANGRIVALPDEDDDGKADDAVIVVDGLRRPNAIAFNNDDMYVAEATRVVRYQMDGQTADKSSREQLVQTKPNTNNVAWSTTINIHNNKLWITAGNGPSRFQGALTRCDLDGSNCQTFATGLRNTVGFTFAPDGTIVGVDMGGGHGNANFPPDEINILEEGNDYGWPKCHANNRLVNNDPNTESQENDPACSGMTPPEADIPPHSSPLGATFYTANAFPEKYRGDMFVGLHGSWQISPAKGYKVARVDWDGDKKIHDFATGWLQDKNDWENAEGRPVDVVVGPDGNMYVSDDKNGWVYRIEYGEETSARSTGTQSSTGGQDSSC